MKNKGNNTEKKKVLLVFGTRPEAIKMAPLVLVHGDTTTTMVVALSAFYQKVDVGHVEAGLRSGNIYSPYPEEMNRRITGTLAKLHFAPTTGNKENLLDSSASYLKMARAVNP